MYSKFTTQSVLLPDNRTRQYLVLFLLWPFLAMVTGLLNYNNKESRRVVYFFLIYYGLTFVITGEIFFDALGYAVKLRNTAGLPFADFFKIIGGIYATDTSVDIIEPLISFIVSRFTTHHSIYFAVWAAIFGFFYLKSVNELFKLYHQNPGWNALIFLVFFIVILPITEINSVRMWTAGWIFFYGAYHVVLYKNARFLVLTFSSVLIHWSFITANAILLIYILAGNRNLIYVPLAVASFVLPNLISPLFKIISVRLGGALQGRYEMYSNQYYIAEREEALEQSAWFMQTGENLVMYYLLIVIIVIQVKMRNVWKSESERNLFSFLMLFLAFVNFGREIPSFGGRYQTIFFLFAVLYVFLYYLKFPNKKITILPFIGIMPIVLHAAVEFRKGADSISALIFAPGFGLPLFGPTISIADILFY